MPIKSVLSQIKQLKKEIEGLSVFELRRELKRSDPPLLIDIREERECVEQGTIPGAKHIPRGMLEFCADPQSPYYRDCFDESSRIVLYCAGGSRSALAVKSLLDMGYTNVAHLQSGFSKWKLCYCRIEKPNAS